tara:strand:+ start:729 stop:1745 length:1017 start_codon:yes stop_codon:yes gene_type:complete
MDPKELLGLESVYKSVYAEAKDESPEKEEEDRKEDDDLAGSPNKDDKKDKKNGKKKVKRWWDDDGDGKGYEKGEVKEQNTLKKEDKKLRKGIKGNPKDIEKADDMAGVGSRKGLPEETLAEKDTYDQVAAVIDMYRSKKGTGEADRLTRKGDTEGAKKEREYAAFERKKMKRDAQRSGHPWEHAKGSTTEKEGKKSEKTKHVRDPQYNSYKPDGEIIRENELWDEIAERLTELHELGGVQFKVVPLNEKEEKDWIQGAVKRPGAFTKKAKAAGMSVQQFAKHVDANKDKYSTRTERQANLAQTFASMKKEGVDLDSLNDFLIKEGADEQSATYILANW